MGQQESPHEPEVIHPEVEIWPADPTAPGSPPVGSRVWVSVDSQAGKFRVHVARPGPIATFPLILAFGVLMVVAFVLALAFFAIFVGVSAVALTGLLIYGVIRGTVKRLR